MYGLQDILKSAVSAILLLAVALNGINHSFFHKMMSHEDTNCHYAEPIQDEHSNISFEKLHHHCEFSELAQNVNYDLPEFFNFSCVAIKVPQTRNSFWSVAYHFFFTPYSPSRAPPTHSFV